MGRQRDTNRWFKIQSREPLPTKFNCEYVRPPPRYISPSSRQSASRAVTQSTPLTHDGNHSEADDTDETQPKVVASQIYPSRRRSHSLSITTPVRHRPDDKLAIFETVRKHARLRHAFAQPPSHDQRSFLTAAASNIPPATIPDPPIRPFVSQQSVDHADAFNANFSPPVLPDALAEVVPSAGVISKHGENRSSSFQALTAARDSGDYGRAIEEVLRLRESDRTPSSLDLNMAIQALCETRQPGNSLAPILETYNYMLGFSLYPSVHTYLILIRALTDRDAEVFKSLHHLQKRRQRRIFSRHLGAPPPVEDQQIAQLRTEDNFALAVSLFEKVVDLKAGGKISTMIYSNLLRSCSNHCDVDTAIRIFAQMERSNVLPSASIFGQLIVAHGKARDIRGAEEVFNEFKAACNSGRILWTRAKESPRTETEARPDARGIQLLVWNNMIDAYFRCGRPAGALGLLEQMMDTTVDAHFRPTDVPPPAPSTFTEIIAGFCRLGDIQTALLWFDRLLQQGRIEPHPYTSSLEPVRPNQLAWVTILETLAFKGMPTELNRLFLQFLENASGDGLDVRAVDPAIVFQANMNDVQTDLDCNSATGKLDFILNYIILNGVHTTSFSIHDQKLQEMMQVLVTQYFQYGSRDKAFDAMERFADARFDALQRMQADGPDGQLATLTDRDLNNFQNVTNGLVTRILMEHDLSFEEISRLLRLSDRVGLPLSRTAAVQFLRAYTLTKSEDLMHSLTLREWEVLVYGATLLELPADDSPASGPLERTNSTLSVLQDMSVQMVDVSAISRSVLHRIVKVLSFQNADQLAVTLASLGASYEKTFRDVCDHVGLSLEPLENYQSNGSLVTADQSPICIDSHHSHFVDEFFPYNSRVTPLVAYSRYESGLENNLFPDPTTIGRLISALGRLGEMEKVRKLYHDAQHVLAFLETDKKRQSQAWFHIEDQMIIACAHAGDLEAAHVHRDRILAQGGTPTADSYGALIECVKDTTDDTSNALALFQEARANGVPPNIYLYNNVISKLAKARKADHALHLFQELKASQLQPSSITYGAVIAACARVGDAYSAEVLFAEMVQQRNYKPRIPPFNTMMQLYAQTKPNRDRVLYYYNTLLDANIRPTAHTYKVSVSYLVSLRRALSPPDFDSCLSTLMVQSNQ